MTGIDPYAALTAVLAPAALIFIVLGSIASFRNARERREWDKRALFRAWNDGYEAGYEDGVEDAERSK